MTVALARLGGLIAGAIAGGFTAFIQLIAFAGLYFGVQGIFTSLPANPTAGQALLFNLLIYAIPVLIILFRSGFSDAEPSRSASFISSFIVAFPLPAIWLITLGAEPIVQETDLDPYKFVASRTDFLGLDFQGVEESPPLLRVGGNAIAYDFIPSSDRVFVNYVVAGRSGQIEFPIWAQYWFSASFSDDGYYLILAKPDRLDIYQTI